MGLLEKQEQICDECIHCAIYTITNTKKNMSVEKAIERAEQKHHELISARRILEDKFKELEKDIDGYILKWNSSEKWRELWLDSYYLFDEIQSITNQLLFERDQAQRRYAKHLRSRWVNSYTSESESKEKIYSIYQNIDLLKYKLSLKWQKSDF